MNSSPRRGLVGAAAVFTLALFLFGGALVRAMSYTPALPAPPPASDPAADSVAPPRQALSMDALMLAVENDPFVPERTRPAERYRLPGDVDPEPPPPPPAPPPLPDFRLSGTVVTSDGGLALIQVGEEAPRMIAMGDMILGYRLAAVTAQGAVMANAEHQIPLRMPSPARVAGATGPARGNARNAQQPGRQTIDPRQMQQVIERARAAGATPQMIESIMRMVQERGMGSIDNLEIGPNGFSIRSGNMNVRQSTATRAEPPPPPRPPRPDTMEQRTPRAPELR